MAPAPPRGRGMRSTGVCGGISICALNYACLVYRFGKTLLVFIRLSLCVRSQELCVLAAATCELRRAWRDCAPAARQRRDREAEDHAEDRHGREEQDDASISAQ
jgi:hypothetical protein